MLHMILLYSLCFSGGLVLSCSCNVNIFVRFICMGKEVEGLWCLLGGLKGGLDCRIFITMNMRRREIWGMNRMEGDGIKNTGILCIL